MSARPLPLLLCLLAAPAYAHQPAPTPTPDHHARQPTDPFTLKPLRGGVHALYGRGGNVGFLVDEAEVTFWGVCPTCQSDGKHIVAQRISDDRSNLSEPNPLEGAP